MRPMRPRYSCPPSATARLLGCVSSRRSIISCPLRNSQPLLAKFIKVTKGPVRKGQQPPLYVPGKLKLREVTGDDLPPLEFWERSSRVKGLTPEDCHYATRIYLQHANPNESTWKGKLERDYDITPQTLNSLAIVLVAGPPSALWRLGLNMLGTASDLGSVPSTLLLIRLLNQSATQDRLSKTPIFISALSRFGYIIRKKQDPDALTLQGLILAEEGNEEQALEFFNLAMQAGSPKPEQPTSEEVISAGGQTLAPRYGEGAEQDVPQQRVRPFRWSWEASCHLGRAKILLRQGRREDAAAALRTAALELDNPQGYFQLAKLLPKDAPERDLYLQIAAVSGIPEACQLLGESVTRMAEQPDQSKDDVLEHVLWASEWFSLAGNTTKPEETRMPFPA